jgi:type I restriction-modification system DNA methylase subunit
VIETNNKDGFIFENMTLCRDLRQGREQLQYPLSEFLLMVSEFESARTTEIKSAVGCSHNTAYKKLSVLESLNVVTSTNEGPIILWELNSATLGQKSIEATITQEKLVCLLIEAINNLAENLCERESLSDELPHGYTEWLAERNMVDSTRAADSVARGCVFDCYLRSTLYGLYESEHTELDPLTPATDFLERFEKAESVTQNSGFEHLPPANLITELTELERVTILSLRSILNATSNPAAALSSVYERLFKQDDRRDLGQFATPSYISDILAEWAVNDADTTVLDPGVGGGILSVAAIAEKRRQGSNTPLQDIWATDVDALSVTMAAVSLKLVDGPGSPQLDCGDFLQLNPKEWTDEARVQTETVDAVVANPPYSRSQALSTEAKAEANNIISTETGIDFHGKSPLYVYFLAHAAQFVADGGRLAFIIPSRFMETEFGTPFKQYLLDQFQIEAIVQLDTDENTFREVRTTTSLVFLEAGGAGDKHEVSFINLRAWPEVDTVSELLALDFDTESDPDGYRVNLTQQLVSPEENWQHYFSPTETDAITGLSKFSDIATIKRGIATGNNDIFCLTENKRMEHTIPDRFLQPIIKSARDIPGFEITEKDWEKWRDQEKKIWLLYAYEDGKKYKDKTPLEDYLEYAKANKDMDRKLLDQRDPWYCVDKRDPPTILGKYMSRTGSQFIHNTAGIRTLGSFHNITPEFKDDERLVKALLAYLNSSIVQKEMSKISRSYSGLEKLEIGALKKASVIDPRDLDSDVVDQLASLFETLVERDRNGEDVDAIRNTIDDLVRKILDLSVDGKEKQTERSAG